MTGERLPMLGIAQPEEMTGRTLLTRKG